MPCTAVFEHAQPLSVFNVFEVNPQTMEKKGYVDAVEILLIL